MDGYLLLAEMSATTLFLRSPKIGHLFLRRITPLTWIAQSIYRGADKSLARPGRKQATAREDFDVHIPYLLGIGVA